MLVSTASSLIGSSPKQISVASSAASGTVFYTVPTGKKFIGYASIANPASVTSILINGANVFITVINSSGGTSCMSRQLVLIAGTTVATATSSQSVSLIGIESDV